MRVLTIWQPWASLIAVGAKPYEFRGRRPPPAYIGQRIGINAGKRPIVVREVEQLLAILQSRRAWQTCLKPETAIPLLERVLSAPDVLPRGAIICTAVLGEARNGFDVAREFRRGQLEQMAGDVDGKINDSDRDQHANFGWPMGDVEVVMPPVEHRGAQGWSEWNPS